MTQMTRCIGCGALLLDRPEPPHAYLSASSGCWGCFNDAMVLHYSNATYWKSHQLLVDTYMLQHSSDLDDKRARKSATLHAAALASQVEYSFDHDRVIALRKALTKIKDFVWLQPPARYQMTIVDVVLDQGAVLHHQTTAGYAESVWEDWSPHHVTIRRLIADHTAS